jgi:hypothetical protein
MMVAVAELELTRSRDDRRLYVIDGVGTLRFEGLFSRRASAESGVGVWSFGRRGVFQATFEATDAAGTVVGAFEQRLRRGGRLRWRDRVYELRPASSWRERYALVEEGRELALLDAKGWGKRPVRLTLEEPDLVEPGLLLFAVFTVRHLAEDADAAGFSATTG